VPCPLWIRIQHAYAVRTLLPTPCAVLPSSSALLALTALLVSFRFDLKSKEITYPYYLTAPGPAPPKGIPDFKKICASSGKQAACCLLGVVRKTYSILVDTIFKPDTTLNRLARVPFAPLPSNFGDPDSRVEKPRVKELFEKATENRR